MDQLCKYGCGQKGVHELKSGELTCNEDWRKCPVIQKNLYELGTKLVKNSKIGRMRPRIKSGKVKCFICGSIAQYPIYHQTKRKIVGCCAESLSKCPGYHQYRSNLKKRDYKNNKKYRCNLKFAMLDVQNRPEVVQAKSKTMKKLHRTDATFINNYAAGRDQFRKYVNELKDKGEHWNGNGESYAIQHINLYNTHKKKSCERCGATHMLMNHIYKCGLHIHCVNKNIKDVSKENWITLCPLCHEKEEKNTK